MNEKRKQYFKIFVHFLLLGLIIFCCVKVLPYMVKLFAPFIIAFIIAMIAEPVVNFLEKKLKLKRKYTALGIIFVILGSFVAIIYFALKWLYNIILGIINDWNFIFTQINDISAKINGIFEKININVDDSAFTDSISKYANNFSTKFVEMTSSFVLNVPLTIFAIVITIMASYFIILSHTDFFNKIIEKNPKFEIFKTQVVEQILKYIRAQFKIMMIIFVILAIGLGFLGIKNFIFLAFVIAFIDLLPILGTGTVMIPWCVIELLYGNIQRCIFLFIIYLVAMIARQILQPKIIGETMEFPAFPTLVVMYVGYKLFGIVGLLISVPVGIIILKIYQVGFFDVYINSIKFIIKDIKQFLKIDFK